MTLKKLPNGWEWKKLRDLVIIKGGKAAPKKEEAFQNGKIPFVRMQDLGKYHLTLSLTETKDKLNEEFVKNNNYEILKKGAILIPRSGSVSLNHRAILGINACIVSHICAIIVDSNKLDNRFLYYTLCNIDMKKIMKKTTGLDAITFQDLSKLDIPLPPLPIQKRIVSILEKADKLKMLRKQNNQETNKIVQALFYEMFGDPKHNDNGWEVKKLVEILKEEKNIVGGPFGSNLKVIDYKDSGIPIMRLQNIQKRKFIDKDIKFISEKKAKELKYHSFKTGDIILAKLGDHLGKSCIVPEKYNYGIVVGDVIRIRIPEKTCNKLYILSLLNSEYCESLLTNQIIGATRPRVNLNNIRDIPVPLPPLSLQNQFASYVEKIEALKEKQKQSEQEINILFDALMQKAFSGELI